MAEAFGDAVRVVRARGNGAAAARNLGRPRGARATGSPSSTTTTSGCPGTSGASPARSPRPADAPLAYFDDAALPAQQGGDTLWANAGFAPGRLTSTSCERGTSWALMARQPLMTPAVVVGRDAYLAAGGMDERLWCREDTHLFLVLGLSGAALRRARRRRPGHDPGGRRAPHGDGIGDRLAALLGEHRAAVLATSSIASARR